MDEPTRIIACYDCGGDGGGFEGGNERWIKCTACNGKGEFEAELESATLEDLEESAACPQCSAVAPAKHHPECMYADLDRFKIASDTQFAWVVEKGSGSDLRYYAPTEPGEWTADHLKACRFARKEDAEAIQFRHVIHGHLPEWGTRVCEHGWF